jgi:hypothetical protein
MIPANCKHVDDPYFISDNYLDKFEQSLPAVMMRKAPKEPEEEEKIPENITPEFKKPSDLLYSVSSAANLFKGGLLSPNKKLKENSHLK